MSSKILVVLGLFVAVGAEAGQVHTHPLHPFSSKTSVPADAVNFTVTQVKLTKIATLETKDYSSCRPSDEPGTPCATVTDSNYVDAIQVDYTFDAPSTALGQDEGSPYNEDYFYIDASTVPATELAKIPAGVTLKGKAAAAVANVSAADAQETTQEIDDKASVWCERRYDDAGSYKVDESCVDQIAYKTVQATVRYASVVLK